jgi:mannose-6-phosphate isomerase-like protein (cupin superfamily)
MQQTKAKHPRKMDIPVSENIIKATKKNSAFRKTVAEGYISELAVMSVPPGNSIGREVHDEADEVLLIIRGKANLSIGDRTKRVKRHDLIFIQSGERHDLRNIGRYDLKLLCFCSPPSTGTTGMHKSSYKASRSLP